MNGLLEKFGWGFVGASVAGLIAWGALSQQVSTNTDQVRLNTTAINLLAREQSSMAANIEWIRRTLERDKP